jgi:hypothetical protein
MHCLNPDCKKEILKQGSRLGENIQAIEPGQGKLIEHKGGISFVRCPYCKARNIFEDVPTPAGQGQNKKLRRYDFEK